MNLFNIAVFILIILAFYIILKLFKVGVKTIFKIILNSIIGCLILIVLNYIPKLNVEVNIINSIIAGTFGVVGIIALVVYYQIKNK